MLSTEKVKPTQTIGKKCYAILVKLNQIGSLSETKTIAMAQKANYGCIISHRSGETEDTFIADLLPMQNKSKLVLLVAIAKYNQLLRILGGARY